MRDKQIRELLRQTNDRQTEQIGETYPATDEQTKDRIFQEIRRRKAAPSQSEITVTEHEPVQEEKRIDWQRFAVTAAALMIAAGGIAGGAFLLRNAPEPPSEPSAAASAETMTETESGAVPSETVRTGSESNPAVTVPAVEETEGAAMSDTDAAESENGAVPSDPPAEETKNSPAPANAEEAAYAYIRDTLVPRYGLSGSALFDMFRYTESGDRCYSPEIPAEAQGIISALVRDLDGNGTRELVTIRLEGYAFILDSYAIGADTCTLLNSYPLLTYDEHTFVQPNIRVELQGDLIVFVNYRAEYAEESGDAAFDAYIAPVFYELKPSRFASEITAVRLTGSGIEEAAVLRYLIEPGGERFTVNGETLTAQLGETDYARAETLARNALDSAGVQYKSFSSGEVPTEPGKEPLMRLELAGSETLMAIYERNDSPAHCIMDNTGLREHLN